MTTMRINHARIRAKRLEQGISERRVCRHMGPGFTTSVLRALEDGTNHEHLSVGELNRLADYLGLALRDLVELPQPETPRLQGPPRHDDWLNNAVAHVSALLHETKLAVPLDVLATVAGITLDEVDAVLHELNLRLQPVGVNVRVLRGEAFLRPTRQLDAMETARVWRERHARHGINLSQARLLHSLTHDTVPATLSNDQRVNLQALVRAGIAQPCDRGHQVAPDVAYSLLMDG